MAKNTENVNAALDQLRKEIAQLREFRAEAGGGAAARRASDQHNQWSIGIWITVIVSALSFAISAVGLLMKLTRP